MFIQPHAKAPRRAVNLSLDSGLVAQARAERLNLSAIAEDAIRRALAQAMERRFHEEIAHSLAEHRAYLAEYGSLADAVRSAAPDSGG